MAKPDRNFLWALLILLGVVAGFAYLGLSAGNSGAFKYILGGLAFVALVGIWRHRGSPPS